MGGGRRGREPGARVRGAALGRRKKKGRGQKEEMKRKGRKGKRKKRKENREKGK
jgi:hypothetical protein